MCLPTRGLIGEQAGAIVWNQGFEPLPSLVFAGILGDPGSYNVYYVKFRIDLINCTTHQT